MSTSESLASVLKSAILMCSGHGWQNVVRKEMFFFKLFWTFFVFVAIVCCCYFIIQTTVEYYSNQVVTNIIIHHVSEMVFPALTLCEINGESPGMYNMLTYCTFGEDECVYGVDYKKINVMSQSLENFDCLRFNGDESNKVSCLKVFSLISQ